MENLVTIANDGPKLVVTNYWDSEHAHAGLCYLSANAGVWRLLVPPEAETMLIEMRTGRTATIEPSLHIPGNVDVVFEDGTDSPFSVSISERQADRAITNGETTLHVWTWRGLELSLPLAIKIR